MSDDVFPHRVDRPWGPDTAVVAFTRMEYKMLATRLGPGRARTPINGGLTKISLYEDLVLAGPVLGAPMAAMTLESLSRRGVAEVYSLGWCGSLTPELTIGRIVRPTSAVSEEGTSDHYPATGSGRPPDLRPALRLTAALDRLGVDCQAGPVWTTDAPFRETRSKAAAFRDQGVLAVDMETAAVMAAAAFLNLGWAGLMVVSDELFGPSWTPGFKSPELKAGLNLAAGAVLEAAAGE